MGTSLAAKARSRAFDVAGAIREALSAGDTHRAFIKAKGALERETKSVRNWRAGDAMLIEARFAGEMAANAALLTTHVPYRPPGCPPVPRPEDLLAVFEKAYEDTLREALGGSR